MALNMKTLLEIRTREVEDRIITIASEEGILDKALRVTDDRIDVFEVMAKEQYGK